MTDMSQVTLENLVSVAEAAKRLGIDASLVKRYIYSKRLRAEKVGGRWLVDAESIESFEPRPVGNPQFSSKSS